MPRRAAAAALPRRFLVWSTPNGTVLDRWVCRTGADDADFTLSEILAPLARHKANMIGLQNLQQFGGHAHGFPAGLTGRPFVHRHGVMNAAGISVDQHVATRWRGQTPLPSLQIGVVVVQNREGASASSWAGPCQPLPPENDPLALWARLFGNGRTEAQAAVATALPLGRSALDSVVTAARGLLRTLGAPDREVVGNYLESLRDLERQMAALGARTATCAAPAIGSNPTDGGDKPWWLSSENVPAVIDMHTRLITAIFACDLTRVITFNLANDGGAYRPHPYIPEARAMGGDWHGVSHAVEKGNAEGLVAIEKWYYGRLAVVLDALAAVRTPDGKSLLAHSLVMTNNEYGPNGGVAYLDGGKNNLTHYARMLPYLLFGQAGGSLRTGRYLVHPVARDGTGVHHTRLLVSVLNALGIPDQTFGDPQGMQGPLPSLG